MQADQLAPGHQNVVGRGVFERPPDRDGGDGGGNARDDVAEIAGGQFGPERGGVEGGGMGGDVDQHGFEPLGVGVAEWMGEAWTGPGPGKREAVVLIKPGSGASGIARQLEGAGAVSNALLFQAELYVRGLSSQAKAGEYALPAFAWHVAGDLSRWRGSPGKHWLGLRVETLDGSAPAPLQAMLREAGSALSWLTLNLGHALAFVPPRRQSLHDRVARTRVVAN